MYQFTLTSAEYPLHTVVNIDLWELAEDGSRTLIALDHVFIPEPSGALFERSQQEFMLLVEHELQKWIARKWDTPQ